jgi:hypothetical protein
MERLQIALAILFVAALIGLFIWGIKCTCDRDEQRALEINHKLDGLETLILVENSNGTWDLYGLVHGTPMLVKGIDWDFAAQATPYRSGPGDPFAEYAEGENNEDSD